MTALKKAGSVKQKLLMTQERGAAFVLAIVASAVLMMLGAAFAMLIGSEAKLLQRQTAYDRALYVAESGIEDVLYQRAKNQTDKCFPFKDDTLNPLDGSMLDTADLAGAPGAMISPGINSLVPYAPMRGRYS